VRITPVILRAGLKAASYQLMTAYRQQFAKMLALTRDVFIPQHLQHTPEPLVPEISNALSLVELLLKSPKPPEGYLRPR
jgi:hypothetical protein